MPAQGYVAVNLLSKDAFSQSLIGKILMWALSIGRYIVVFTELIVILSFLSRFKLDRDLTDLNAQISQQQLVIESYGDLEPRFRSLQTKLAFIREKVDQAGVEEVLDELVASLPADVRFTQVSVQQDRISITAVALSPNGFSRFVKSLQTQRMFSNLELSNITSDEETSTGIAFDLRINLSGAQR